MSHAKSKIKTCHDYKIDLSILMATGRINDNYINHLNECNDCLTEMQKMALKDLRALSLKENPRL